MIQAFATDETTHAIYGAAGGTMGTGVGVAAGLIFMLFVYGLNQKTIKRQVARDIYHEEESLSDVLRIIFLLVTPVIFTTFIYNASAYLDSYIFPVFRDGMGLQVKQSPSSMGNSAIIM